VVASELGRGRARDADACTDAGGEARIIGVTARAGSGN
jgi:hypothetical protein